MFTNKLHVLFHDTEDADRFKQTTFQNKLFTAISTTL